MSKLTIWCWRNEAAVAVKGGLKMPVEKEPVRKVAQTHVPPGSALYRVKDGDTWISVAQAHALDPWDLIESISQRATPPRSIGICAPTSASKRRRRTRRTGRSA